MDQDNDHQFDRNTSQSRAQQRWAHEVSFADKALESLGVYINHERTSKQTSSRKHIGETVALVLEDDPDQLALATLRLTTAGYVVQSADRVQAFYRRLERSVPDAIFLDIELPDGNGLDVLAALRRNPTYARMPIIMVTSRKAPEDIARGLALGADGYITKPYGKNTLEYALRYVMRQEIGQ